MANVSLENLGKTYPGGVRAVDRLDLSVAEGEFLVLVGPSGSGKSTILRMIAGLEQPSDGTIRIGDRVVNHTSPRDRDVAMVFQNYALYPNKTVRGNMAFGLGRRGVAKAEIARRVAWAAELLGLQKLLGRKPHALSGGQRQRVALARALVRRPKLFLFDEPLSNLDAQLRSETRAELKRLHRQLAVTTIYVTHDQEEAMTLGDRIAVLHDGRLQQCGAPLDVYNQPVNRFVAGFIGTPAMNFIEGRLSKDTAGQLWFESPALRGPIAREIAGSQRLAESDPAVAADTPREIAGSQRLAESDPRVPPPPRAVGSRLLPHELDNLTDSKNVTLGIRPEHLRLQPAPGPAGEPAWSIAGTVEVVEPLGSIMDLHIRLADGQRLVCRLPAEQVQYNSKAELYPDWANALLFAAHGRES